MQKTYTLKNIIKALSKIKGLELLKINTTEDLNRYYKFINELESELQLAKKELAKRDLILKQHEKIKLILR